MVYYSLFISLFVGNNILSLTKQEVGTDGQGFHKWQAMVKGTGNGWQLAVKTIITGNLWSQPHDIPLNGSPLSQTIKSETEAESILVVLIYLKDPSAYKALKTVPRADNKYPGRLSNVPPYT
jgi:hypothetical protein